MKTLFLAIVITIMLGCASDAAQGSSNLNADSLRVTPATLENGSPCLITVELQPDETLVSGQWQGREIVFFPSQDRRRWFALAGVDVETTPGSYPLTVELRSADGRRSTLHSDIAVEAAPYEKVTLHVPDKFVAPDAAALRTIAADKVLKDKAFADSAPEPKWTGNFSPPLKMAPRSDSFGTRRVFNGTLSSVHRGLDYRAAMGTPVAAINAGRVVLAAPLYYEGGCVMIDHGLGLMSIYMHLSKIDVAVGDSITRGKIVALSGGSGRATGPHLHLGVRWQGSYLDPAKLFALNLPRPR